MKVRDALEHVRDGLIEIKENEERKDALRQRLIPSGLRYDVDKVQTTRQDQMLIVMSQMDEIDDVLANLKANIVVEYCDCTRAISHVSDPKYRRILALYYLEPSPMQWDDVALRMGYTEDYCRHMSKRALEEADRFYQHKDDTQ